MRSAQVRAIFEPPARAALTEFGIEPKRVQLVAQSENVTFRVVERQAQRSYVLRLHRPGYHTLDELNAERVWMRALEASGINVPIGVPSVDGREYVAIAVHHHATTHGEARDEQRQVGLARWTEGRQLFELLQERPHVEVVAHYYRRLGALMAAMHLQACAWTLPSDFARHSFDADGLLGDTPFWGPYWTHPAFTAREQQLLRTTGGKIRDVLLRYGHDSGNYSLIHADLHSGNLLVQDDALTVIDFDDAGFGWHQYDLAVALFHHRFSPTFPQLRAALLEGYRTLRPLPEGDLTLLPMFLLIRSLVLIGWMQQRPELRRGLAVAQKRAVLAGCVAFVPPY